MVFVVDNHINDLPNQLFTHANVGVLGLQAVQNHVLEILIRFYFIYLFAKLIEPSHQNWELLFSEPCHFGFHFPGPSLLSLFFGEDLLTSQKLGEYMYHVSDVDRLNLF